MHKAWSNLIHLCMEKFDDKYYVNVAGVVFNKRKNKEISQSTQSKGYKRVNIYLNGENKLIPVHRLVAQKYIPNPNNKPQVNHIDGDKTNNHVSNLEWVTNKENAQHAQKHGLRASKKGSLNGWSKLNESQVVEIKKLLTNKVKLKDVAQQFNVGISTISAIKTKQNWSWV